MKADPAIDAIREIRHKISASVGHDARKLIEHYRQLQKRHPEKVLSRCTMNPKMTDAGIRGSLIGKEQS